MTDFRNNDRCIIDDVDMATMLFERIRSYLPETWEKHQIVGLNERLRFLRYDPGQKFEKHMGKNKILFDLVCFYVIFIFDLNRWCLLSSGWIR
jgi:hypothetical protein